MTERRQYEEHLAFTLRELSHRTKNMLAVVQGLTHMIARRADDIEDFEMRLRGCIQALAYSHDLLVQHDWQGATLEELLRVQLAPFGGIDGGRFVRRRTAGLSAAAGDAVARPDHARARHQCDQAWRAVEPGGVGGDRLGRASSDGVKLTWQESGGPPVDAAAPQGVRAGGVRADRGLARRRHRDRFPPRGVRLRGHHRGGKPPAASAACARFGTS